MPRNLDPSQILGIWIKKIIIRHPHQPLEEKNSRPFTNKQLFFGQN